MITLTAISLLGYPLPVMLAVAVLANSPDALSGVSVPRINSGDKHVPAWTGYLPVYVAV